MYVSIYVCMYAFLYYMHFIHEVLYIKHSVLFATHSVLFTHGMLKTPVLRTGLRS